jgi:glycosyltransferase involved in cell wall biosynthesis
MNILHLSTADIEGGAAQATHQIHSLLREAGHRSILAVRRKTSCDPDVVPVGIRPLPLCSWLERSERFRSRLAGGYRVESRPLFTFNRNLGPVPDWDGVLKILPKPDMVVLHWITHLVTAADIRRLAERVACPIVWLLMDMEPMTGGCHYPGECRRFQDECTDCPQLQTGGGRDWAGRTWREKRKQLADLPITFVAPTRWLAERLARSGLFRGHAVEQIPLPLNPHLQPLEKAVARKILGLPPGKKIVLVGSHNLKDPRKGMDRLIAAARCLKAPGACADGKFVGKEEILFLLMGGNAAELSLILPYSSQAMGYVRSEVELSLAYQAADVFACPSLEDAGPMMVSQAMMCGTPVVAFDTGIVPELIASGGGGYMARLGDAEDFARGLKKMLEDDGSAGRQAAEIAVRHHDPRRIEQAYERMFAKLVGAPMEGAIP